MSYSWDYDNSISAEMVRQLLAKAGVPEANRYEPITEEVEPGFAAWADPDNDIDDRGAVVWFTGNWHAREQMRRKAIEALEDAGWSTLEVDPMHFRTRVPEVIRKACGAQEAAEREADELLTAIYRAGGCERPSEPSGACAPGHADWYGSPYFKPDEQGFAYSAGLPF